MLNKGAWSFLERFNTEEKTLIKATLEFSLLHCSELTEVIMEKIILA